MEDDGGGGGRRRSYNSGDETNASTTGITLGGILSIKETTSYRIRNRTLLDLIHDDQICRNESKKPWKMFGEKLRLKLVGSVCTTTVPTIASHVRVSTDGNRLVTRNGTNRLNSPPVTQTANVRIETPVEENRRNGGDGGEPTTVKMTLMSLLEIDASNAHVSTDSNRLTTRNDSSILNSQSPPVSNGSSLPVTQVAIVRDETPVVEDEQTEEENRREPATVKVTLMSLLEINASACFGDDDEEDQAEEVAVVEDDGGGDRKYNKCCVCMVRNKGAAFIPCGHTFCRVCSREVFVKRATCPLCNHFISEILDIF